MVNYLDEILKKPIYIIGLLASIFLLGWILMSSMSNKSISYVDELSGTSSGDSGMFVNFVFILIFIACVVFGLKYIGIDLVAKLQSVFQTASVLPETTIEVQPTKNSILPNIANGTFGKRKQVFNVNGNYYNYENARALCKAYGAELATYSQVEDAYKDGGEWCNYGWSEGQMALFPTQQSSFDKLQSIKGHEHDCGRVGVNGGYIANPNVQYGVNCYGVKPNIKAEEEYLMNNTTPYPITQEDIEFQKKVDAMKTRLNEILISPFNYSSWNK
jgi:hypothetical protein